MDKNHKTIKISKESYEKIIRHSTNYANSSIPEDQWKMVYGLLSGYSDDQYVYVVNTHRIATGSANEVSLGDQDYIELGEMGYQLDSEGKGHYIVGNYHSKPGFGLYMSYTDLMSLFAFQIQNSDFFTLVFDITLMNKSLPKRNLGMEIYRLSDIEMNPNNNRFANNYENVDFTIEN